MVMDPTALSSAWMLGVGSVGGALNAVLTDNLSWRPSRVMVSSHRRIVRPGLAANIFIGAAAAFGSFLALTGGGCPAGGRSIGSSLMVVLAGMFIGLAAARWMTNESDKSLLRAAACKACAAPAAHPDTVRAIEVAPPYAVSED